MKKLLLLPLLFVLLAGTAFAQPTTKIYGYIYNTLNQPDSGQFVTIHRVIVNGQLISRIPKTVRTDGNGYFSFEALCNATIYVAANIDGFRKFSTGVARFVPCQDSARLVDLPQVFDPSVPLPFDTSLYPTVHKTAQMINDSIQRNVYGGTQKIPTYKLDLPNYSQEISDSIQASLFGSTQKIPSTKIDFTAGPLDVDTTFNVRQRSNQDVTGNKNYLGRISGSGLVDTVATSFLWDPDKGSFAAGDTTTSLGYFAVALGEGSRAFVDNTTALGYKAVAENLYSTSIGYETKALGQRSISIGVGNLSEGQSSLALGYANRTVGEYSTSLGAWGTATGPFATALGFSSFADGYHSLAAGHFSKSIGFVSTTFGASTEAYSDFSTAFGFGTRANRSSQLVFGAWNDTTSSSLMTIGNGDDELNRRNAFEVFIDGGFVAYAKDSALLDAPISSEPRTLWNPKKRAFRSGSAGIEWEDWNMGLYSTAFGFYTKASGEGSFAAGIGSTALGEASVSIGAATAATGEASAAFGSATEAIGVNSFVVGSATKAYGGSSAAFGSFSEAMGPASFAFGYYVKADDSAQTVVGRFNDTAGVSLFSVGNGTSISDLRNAFGVYKDGSAKLGLGPWGKDSLYVATKSYVDNIVAALPINLPLAWANIDTTGAYLLAGRDYYDTNPLLVSPTHKEGRLFYDPVFQALSYFVGDPNVTLQIGQENWVPVRNNSHTTTIQNGTVVYIVDGQAGIAKVEPAIASDLDATPAVLGVATQDIAPNGRGFVTTFGLVRDLKTSPYPEGSKLYLSADTAGLLTVKRPDYPKSAIMVGEVVYTHNNRGIVMVHIRNTMRKYAMVDSMYNYRLESDTLGFVRQGSIQTVTGQKTFWQPKATAGSFGSDSLWLTTKGYVDTRVNEAIISAGDTVTLNVYNLRMSGTLDSAYNFGGSGAGRELIANNGAVLISGTDGIVSTGTHGSGVFSTSGAGTKLVWTPQTSSFRAGAVSGTEWDSVNTGQYSVAFGKDVIASARSSAAIGEGLRATAPSQAVVGKHNDTSGAYLFVVGSGSTTNKKNAFSVDTNGTIEVTSIGEGFKHVVWHLTDTTNMDDFSLLGLGPVDNPQTVFTLDTGEAWSFTGQVIALSEMGEAKSFDISGRIINKNGTIYELASTSISGVTNSLPGDPAFSWQLFFVPYNDSFYFITKGSVDTRIRWSGRLNITQVRW